MVWRILPSLSLLLAPMWALAADSPDNYFHAGVQDYIFGEKEKAKTEIGTGLQIYPEDPKLNGAWKLLQKKEQENQQQQNKDQKNQDQKDKKDQKDQQQNQQQQQDQKQQQQKSEQQKKDEQKAKQEQARKDQEKREQEAQAQQGEQKDKKDEQAQQAATELHMSPQEARKLLESLKDESKVLLFSPTNQPVKTQPGKFKDW